MYYNYYITEYSLSKITNFISGYSPRYRANYFDRYIYVIDYILKKSSTHYNKVPVNHSQLSKILGTDNRNTTLILKNLVASGCIEQTRNYEVGVVSNCFSIPESHTDCMQIKSVNKKSLANKIIKQHNKGKYIESKEGQIYFKYIKNIDINNYDYINNNISSILNIPMSESYKVQRGIKRQKTNLLRIKNKELFITRKDPLSRVCCNFSVLHNKLRKYLTYEGQSLKAIDIRNSQPLLAGMFIKNSLKGVSIELTKEVDLYLDRCQKGMFYEDFMQENDVDRKTFKQKFFEQVFFSRVTKRKTKLKKMFIAKYPNIYNIICDLKGDNYKNFAIGLQRFEANIIFDKINLPMLKEGYGCFNIYDSIVSHSTAVLEEAKKRIYFEFSKYGVRPTLNIEDFNS